MEGIRTKQYFINKIGKDVFDKANVAMQLDGDTPATNTTKYYTINDCFYFSHASDIDIDFAPYFIEIDNILFVAFYDKVFGVSLLGKIRFAVDLEFTLMGIEERDRELYIITDGDILRVRCSLHPELCHIAHHLYTLNESGFVYEYKRIDGQALKLIYEDGSIAEYSLSDSSFIVKT